MFASTFTGQFPTTGFANDVCIYSFIEYYQMPRGEGVLMCIPTTDMGPLIHHALTCTGLHQMSLFYFLVNIWSKMYIFFW